jgi:hypothetical protein
MVKRNSVTTTDPGLQTLPLVGRQQLVIERGRDRNVLKVVGSDGSVKLSVHITPAGPVLRFEGSGLMIETAGDLAIAAEQVSIHGREGVVITSGKDAHICVEGDLSLRAAAQNITAELGDVNVRANDDVMLDGERIRMNC